MNIKPEYVKKLLEIPDPEQRRKWLYGEWPAPTCDVHDNAGNHCPEPATHFFQYNGNDAQLCDKCYKLFKAGVFSRRKYELSMRPLHRPTAAL